MTDDPVSTLLQRVATGDRAAFRALYPLAAPKLVAVLMRILGNRADVDDALQEVFVRVWQRAGQFQPDRGRGQAWLNTVARHHALDRLRARPEGEMRRHDSEDDPLSRIPDPAAGAEAGLIAKGEARRVLDCLQTLDPARASAVRGAYLTGLSYHELATRHGLPLNTVRTWLRRGLQQLRECMER